MLEADTAQPNLTFLNTNFQPPSRPEEVFGEGVIILVTICCGLISKWDS